MTSPTNPTGPLTRDINFSGPVNGSNQPDETGSYIRIVLTNNHIREERLITISAAAVFNAELGNALERLEERR